MFGFLIMATLIVIAIYLVNTLNVLSLGDLTEAVTVFREFLLNQVK